MMCRIDWGVKVRANRISGRRFARPTASWVIAIFFCFPLAPSAIFAEPNKNLAPDEDIPEEVLRTEIYTDARSPIDGKLLTATEYVELMDQLRSLDHIPPENFVSPKVREVVELLRLRKLLRQFIPFIP